MDVCEYLGFQLWVLGYLGHWSSVVSAGEHVILHQAYQVSGSEHLLAVHRLLSQIVIFSDGGQVSWAECVHLYAK